MPYQQTLKNICFMQQKKQKYGKINNFGNFC